MTEETKNKSTDDDSAVNDSDGATANNAQESEDMSEDDMAMFNKIMGEIQEVGDSDEEEADDDSASDDGNNEQSDEDLDEDQQKAFENIMAQIESGADPESGDGDEESDDLDEDDFAAELEKLAQEVDSVSEGEDKDAAEPAEEKEDEEKAESDDAKAPPASEADGPPEEDAQPDPPAATEPGEDVIVAEADSGDNVDEIEDILKEIATDDGQPSEDDQEEEAEEEAPTDKPAKKEDDEESVADAIRALEASVGESEAKPAEKKTPKTPSKKASKKAASKSTPSEKKEASSKPKADASKPGISISIGRKTVVFIVSLVLIATLGIGGYYGWERFFKKRSQGPLTNTDTPGQGTPAVSSVRSPEPTAPINDNVLDQQRVKNKIDEIDLLRNDLIAKRNEIKELQDYYHTGIDAEIQNLADIFRKSGIEGLDLEKAMQKPNVGMAVMAIQRRDGYIKKLDTPAKLLYLNSEELLYLYRKAKMLSLMVEKTSDIDVDGFIEEADGIMETHRRDLAQLNIDDVDVVNSNITQIWERIKKQLKTKMNRKGRIGGDLSEDETIWKAMCKGDFSRKHKLTALSEDAAECLAAWKGSDLYLNQLTTLTPEAARRLSKWKGSWLGLNGLKELSPETATYLAQWHGKGMSLNGLSRLSPRLVAILSEWQGEEIELINVKHMAHWENPNTRLFLSEEMDRKLKENRF